MQGLKQGCIASPILFSLLVNELANEIFAKARHGIPLGPTDIELFLLLFADDLTLLASTVIGLQNQLNVLSVAAERLCLTVNLDKSKVIVFRKGGFWAAKEHRTQFRCGNGGHVNKSKEKHARSIESVEKDQL